MKDQILQNIDISSQIIVFDQQSHTGQLTITNKHQTFGAAFKIKATKLNIIDVKPAKGFIKPQGKVVINFKLSSSMTQQQMESTQNNDKFLIQFLNVANQQASKQQVQGFWKAFKNNTANLQHGYGCYKVFMNLTGKRRLAVSNIKSQTANSHMYKTVNSKLNGDGENSAQKGANDEQLSNKYTELKNKQQQLRQQRQSIFKNTGSTTKSKGGKLKTYIVLIFFFTLAFMAGNYVRSSMVKVKHAQKLKQQKKSFFHFNFFQ